MISSHATPAKIRAVVFSLICSLLLAGCSTSGHTARRAAIIGTGTAAGAAAGYAIDKKPGAAAIGGVAGAILTTAALGDDKAVYQDGFDEGYVQGQADAIKRQYFLRQALEQNPPPDTQSSGKKAVYVVPGPKVTVDGRQLEEHKVAIEVTE